MKTSKCTGTRTKHKLMIQKRLTMLVPSEFKTIRNLIKCCNFQTFLADSLQYSSRRLLEADIKLNNCCNFRRGRRLEFYSLTTAVRLCNQSASCVLLNRLWNQTNCFFFWFFFTVFGRKLMGLPICFPGWQSLFFKENTSALLEAKTGLNIEVVLNSSGLNGNILLYLNKYVCAKCL